MTINQDLLQNCKAELKGLNSQLRQLHKLHEHAVDGRSIPLKETNK